DAEGGLLTFAAISYNQSVLPEITMSLGDSGNNPYTFTSAQGINYLTNTNLTPSPGNIGISTVVFGLADSTGLTSVNIVNLNVNDLPEMSTIDNQTINVNSITGPIAFTVGDAGTSVSELVVVAESAYTTLVPNANMLISGTSTNRTLEITPVNDVSGTAYITLTLSDGNTSCSKSFTLTVNGAPSISTLSGQTTQEDTAINPITFTVTDDSDPCALSIS
ncbi:hypothetical protein MHK_009493, partial [Candidatus Magnetomorum sp. HK-1]